MLLVVAADGGWMPQSAEHLAAIDAVGIRHGVLAVTRSDLADPGPATRQALEQVAGTSLGPVEVVPVSAVTGAGLPELRAALARLMARLPVPDPGAPVRLWVDRSFTIRGSGTVVTGTLPAGTVRTGQELLLTPSMRPVRIRGIESLNEPAASVSGVARIALNLRGLAADVPARGMALVDPGRWTMTRLADVRLCVRSGLRLPAEMTLHIGSARTVARIRPLGPAHGQADLGTAMARLTLREPLPLHVGDRVLLRDPGSAGLAIAGATVLDVASLPTLGRRDRRHGRDRRRGHGRDGRHGRDRRRGRGRDYGHGRGRRRGRSRNRGHGCGRRRGCCWRRRSEGSGWCDLPWVRAGGLGRAGGHGNADRGQQRDGQPPLRSAPVPPPAARPQFLPHDIPSLAE